MFEGPEYASYIALCRELRLERKAQAGDWFISRDAQERPDGQDSLTMCGQDGYQCHDAPFWDDSWEVVWLPRLDQWLAMLETAGLPDVFFVPRWAAGQFQRWSEGQKTMTGPCGEGPTREEAAARLWKAVVDKIAQREGVTSY